MSSNSSKFTDASTLNVRFQSVNPFEALKGLDSTDKGETTSSSDSSDSNGPKDGAPVVSTPSADHANAFRHATGQYQTVASPQQARNVSTGTVVHSNSDTNAIQGTASVPDSPVDQFDSNVAKAAYAYRAPPSASRQSANEHGRQFNHNEHSRKTSNDYGRKSSFGNSRKPSLGHSRQSSYGGHGRKASHGFNRKGSHGQNNQAGYVQGKNDSLIGISEGLTVQELAYRQGQTDIQNNIHIMPASPFRRQLDPVWAEYYQAGRESGVAPLTHPIPQNPQDHCNYAWPVLINPYTQSLDAPNGVFDQNWAIRQCEMALKCMEALVHSIVKRGNGWEKTVVDVPQPIREAIVQFPGLMEQYEQLKRDAKEALSGGRPFGY